MSNEIAPETEARGKSTNRSIYLPVELLEKLEAQAKANGRTLNGHVRWLLERGVAQVEANGNGEDQ